jgi:redox-sensitive bicupin YhaK (pirin superfamily)
MIDIRPFDSLGHADHGWLDARHHFSFASYHDPDRMGWGRIRVWNDDTIGAKSGFPPHPHRDMEIVTYVRTGAITHQDSMGNKGRTAAGDVQVMSAGTGVTHAEYNLEDEQTTLFQIWIETDEPGAQPGWGAMPFPKEAREGSFQILASGNPDDGALTINADARVLGATVKAGGSIAYDTAPDRHLYLVPSGRVRVNGQEANPRDGVAITGESKLTIEAEQDSELVLVDAR